MFKKTQLANIAIAVSIVSFTMLVAVIFGVSQMSIFDPEAGLFRIGVATFTVNDFLIIIAIFTFCTGAGAFIALIFSRTSSTGK